MRNPSSWLRPPHAGSTARRHPALSFFHSIALACLMGLFVTMQAYVWPFRLMVN
jgi:hypothetical protein